MALQQAKKVEDLLDVAGIEGGKKKTKLRRGGLSLGSFAHPIVGRVKVSGAVSSPSRISEAVGSCSSARLGMSGPVGEKAR